MDVFDGLPVYDHHHLDIVYHNTANTWIIFRKFESAFFKSFVVEFKSTTLPMQEYELIPVFIDEYKKIAVAGITFQVILYQGR